VKPRIRISPLSLKEIAILRRPENAGLHAAYGAALAGLHGLAARHTGSWYFVAEPDEDAALEMVSDDVARLGSSPFLAARMRANLDAYHRLRQFAFRNDGSTEEVREVATRLMHAFADEHATLYSSEGAAFEARRAAAG